MSLSVTGFSVSLQSSLFLIPQAGPLSSSHCIDQILSSNQNASSVLWYCFGSHVPHTPGASQVGGGGAPNLQQETDYTLPGIWLY